MARDKGSRDDPPRGERPLRLRVSDEVEPLRLANEAPGAPSRWTGEALRAAREARALSLAAIAERTKIPRAQIEAVEGDRYDLLPPVVYLRGILLALAKELRLDGQKVARSYLDAMQESAGR